MRDGGIEARPAGRELGDPKRRQLGHGLSVVGGGRSNTRQLLDDAVENACDLQETLMRPALWQRVHVLKRCLVGRGQQRFDGPLPDEPPHAACRNHARVEP